MQFGRATLSLCEAVKLEARPPLSRFGVHGMSDPAGMIADMLKPRPVTLFYYGSGREEDQYARVFQEGRRYIVVHRDDVIGEVDAKKVVINRSKGIIDSEVTLGCRDGMFVLYDHRCGMYNEIWRGGRCPAEDRTAYPVNFRAWKTPNIAEAVVVSGPHWNFAVMFHSGNVKLVKRISDAVDNFCAWKSHKLNCAADNGGRLR